MTEPNDRRLLKQPACRSFRGICRTGPTAITRRSIASWCTCLRDVHRAEDLTQETFATAWERIGHIPGSIDAGHLAAPDRLHEIHRRPAVGSAHRDAA